jgi:alkylated DNA repair dioxygenase AlkB
MGARPEQGALFAVEPALPNGLLYRADFVSPEQEAELLSFFGTLHFREARYHQYTARRRVMRFGEGSYLDNNEDDDFPRLPFPPLLAGLRTRVANCLGVPAEDFVHGLVTEYRPGTPIGWHRDAPHFRMVAGLSLASACRMRFRPYERRDTRDSLSLELQPRSLYVMRDDIRWRWQHHIPPAPALRYSVTLRTLA